MDACFDIFNHFTHCTTLLQPMFISMCTVRKLKKLFLLNSTISCFHIITQVPLIQSIEKIQAINCYHLRRTSVELTCGKVVFLLLLSIYI